MIVTETARLIVLVLLGLCVIWVVYIIVKKESSTLLRAVLVTVLVGLAFIYLNETKLERLTFRDVKDDLFPPKNLSYVYEKREITSGAVHQTLYVFPEPGPRLSLRIEEGGKYTAIRNINPINRLLDFLGLPRVSEGVIELSAITGRENDANIFRWEKYELGTLTIERSICQDTQRVQSYPCVIALTVRYR